MINTVKYYLKEFDKVKESYLLIPNRSEYLRMVSLKKKIDKELLKSRKEIEKYEKEAKETQKELDRWKLDLKKISKMAVKATVAKKIYDKVVKK